MHEWLSLLWCGFSGSLLVLLMRHEKRANWGLAAAVLCLTMGTMVSWTVFSVSPPCSQSSGELGLPAESETCPSWHKRVYAAYSPATPTVPNSTASQLLWLDAFLHPLCPEGIMCRPYNNLKEVYAQLPSYLWTFCNASELSETQLSTCRDACFGVLRSIINKLKPGTALYDNWERKAIGHMCIQDMYDEIQRRAYSAIAPGRREMREMFGEITIDDTLTRQQSRAVNRHTEEDSSVLHSRCACLNGTCCATAPDSLSACCPFLSASCCAGGLACCPRSAPCTMVGGIPYCVDPRR